VYVGLCGSCMRFLFASPILLNIMIRISPAFSKKKTTPQALCKEWENLAFKPQHSVEEDGAIRRRHLR
jgi:hypothetical protein